MDRARLFRATTEGLGDAADAAGRDGGKYVYCIIRQEAPRDFGEVGIGGGSACIYGSLTAISPRS